MPIQNQSFARLDRRWHPPLQEMVVELAGPSVRGKNAMRITIAMTGADDPWQNVAKEILRLSSTVATSSLACPRGVLVSVPCPAGDACRFCPGLKRLQLRDAQPVSGERESP